MDSRQEDGFVQSVRERMEEAGGAIENKVGDVSADATSAVNEAVNIADRSVDSASTFIDEMGQEAFNVLSTVVDIFEDYITENDLEMHLSEHRIHIEGDAEGLRKIQADLKEALKGNDVHVKYDREEGVNIEFGDSVK